MKIDKPAKKQMIRRCLGLVLFTVSLAGCSSPTSKASTPMSFPNGFVSVTHNICNPVDQVFDLAHYLPDENKDGVVDWVADQIREYAGDPALTAERTGRQHGSRPMKLPRFFQRESLMMKQWIRLMSLPTNFMITGMYQQ